MWLHAFRCFVSFYTCEKGGLELDTDYTFYVTYHAQIASGIGIALNSIQFHAVMKRMKDN